MSNHSGSYMLSDVLKLLEKNGIFEFLGEEKTHRLILDVIKIGTRNDCNDGEILEEIGERIGICCCCLNKTKDFERGLCKECR